MPPGDEPRVLAALQHPRQPVDRRIGVAAAHALDEGGDGVVVGVAGAVVDDGAPRRPRAARVTSISAPVGRRRPAAPSSALSATAGVAPGAGDDRRPRLLATAAPAGEPAFGVGRARSSSSADSSGPAAPARSTRSRDSSGGVHLEVRVLGGRADERDEPVLDTRQQRVLLRLVEPVDLVEEEDGARCRRLARSRARPRRRARRPRLAETADSSSNSAGTCRGDDPREGGLARCPAGP